jgi:DNA-binding MarR family transcriptional regulator
MDDPADEPADPLVDDFEKRAIEKIREIGSDVDFAIMGAVFNTIRLATHIVARAEAQIHRKMGGSWAGFRILFVVWVSESAEPRQLAHYLGLTRSAISAVLNTLERDGLVRRTRSCSDGRVVNIELTPAGRDFVVAGFLGHHQVEVAWMHALDEGERLQLAQLLRKALANPPL